MRMAYRTGYWTLVGSHYFFQSVDFGNHITVFLPQSSAVLTSISRLTLLARSGWESDAPPAVAHRHALILIIHDSEHLKQEGMIWQGTKLDHRQPVVESFLFCSVRTCLLSIRGHVLRGRGRNRNERGRSFFYFHGNVASITSSHA